MGVSPSSVHRVIHNKPGVGEKLRQEILSEIKASGYEVNSAAASLRRSPKRVLSLIPSLTTKYPEHFESLQEGVRKAVHEFAGDNVTLVEVELSPFSFIESLVEHLDKVLNGEHGTVDALIILCWTAESIRERLAALQRRGVPILILNPSTQTDDQFSMLRPAPQPIGTLSGEMMCLFNRSDSGRILVLGGDPYNAKHISQIAEFTFYLREHRPTYSILEIHEFDPEKIREELSAHLEAFHNIIGIYCNNYRSTLVACEEIQARGLSRSMSIIGCDVYPKLAAYFENGTLDASIYQNTSLWAYEGTKRMLSSMLFGVVDHAAIRIPVFAVTKSNYRLLI